jgi:two-component system KDP operon response regulator KdpE
MEKETRILVVEDDRAISDFLSLALTDEGYSVATAENGWIGLTLIDSFKPDLILLDMRLPVLDGKHFIAVHKASPQPAPIIGISAVRSARGLAESLGINDFLEKPFSLDNLLERVANCLAGMLLA